MSQQPDDDWARLLRSLERERVRVVSQTRPQRDRSAGEHLDPDPRGKRRLDEATREAWGES